MFGPKQDFPKNSPFDGLFTRSRMPSVRPPSPQQPISNQAPLMTDHSLQHTGHKQTRRGLLSKFFQKNNRPSTDYMPQQQGIMANSFQANLPNPNPNPTTIGAAATGGGLATVLGFLENTQKSLEVVQTFAPMVQQYGPLVKSLPEIISMFSDKSEEKDETNEENNVENIEDIQTTSAEETIGSDEILPNPNEVSENNEKKEKREHKVIRKKSSVGETPLPKLYV